MAFVLFIMAMGYANNLIYMFVFFLISVAFTGMVLTNRNVANVKIKSIGSDGLFAKEPGEIFLSLETVKARSSSWNLQFAINKKNTQGLMRDLKENAVVTLPWIPEHRGLNRLPVVAVKSAYPFGLLQAWQNRKDQEQILVFPQRKGRTDLPQEGFGSERPDNAGVFREHRAFQSSDSPRRVDWRASARRQELLIKNHEEPESKSIQLTWEQTESIADFEGRISQLSLWVDEAERKGIQYSLSVGGFQSAVSRGPAHWKTCMERLALLSMKEVV